MKMKNPNTMIKVGLVFLLLANLGRVARHFLEHASDFTLGMTDGAMGVAYGVAIGLMLLGIRLNARKGPGGACGA